MCGLSLIISLIFYGKLILYSKTKNPFNFGGNADEKKFFPGTTGDSIIIESRGKLE